MQDKPIMDTKINSHSRNDLARECYSRILDEIVSNAPNCSTIDAVIEMIRLLPMLVPSLVRLSESNLSCDKNLVRSIWLILVVAADSIGSISSHTSWTRWSHRNRSSLYLITDDLLMNVAISFSTVSKWHTLNKGRFFSNLHRYQIIDLKPPAFVPPSTLGTSYRRFRESEDPTGLSLSDQLYRIARAEWISRSITTKPSAQV